ncbi:DNA starvation/stationary phase protection protein [Canibacter sp. lx-45]|uniref:Dps family protein n=1 Tax=Canibacter zhuwentaonis TaxID=2837491 RepID=UPI001BDC03CD|nr:DNA starvation/stationary phase protection protein [Canibacter zhuwentaonis]MBT1035698.1 DNA starvation/stationary phase protection protein [Canibacter zhuwentaonis]
MAQNKTLTASPDLATGVAQFLTPVVRDLIALSVNAKQAHWHLRGVNFVSLHEFLDTVADHAREAYDTAAERVVALGLPIDARLTTVAQKATNPVPAEGFQQYEQIVADMLEQFDAALGSVREAVKELDEIDPVSQDIAIAIQQQLEQDRWFLYAHIGS